MGRLRLGALIALSVSVLFGSAAVAQAAPVSVGHSGWFWGDPQPQGETLNGIDFAGSRGYAAGDFGTLLRTDDAGATWDGLPTGITAPLVNVRVVDANTVVIGGDCALRRSDDGGQTFTRLPWTASDRNCPSPIAAFHFPSAAVGYLMTEDGSILRTDDQGATFARKTSIPGTPSTGGSRTPTDIFFTGADTGVATTRGGGDGKVFRTTDGGNSWTEVASASGPGHPPHGLNGLEFVGGTGYAVGDGKTLLQSTDSGATWAPKPLTGTPGSPNLTSIGCADPTTCLITEQSGGQLVRTTDSGDTGTSVTPSTEQIFAVAFSSATRAVAVGAGGATVTSNNTGSTWAPVGARISGTGFSHLRATNSQIAEVGGSNGVLARTIDGGMNWFTVGVPTTGAVMDASFPTQNDGFALDDLGGAFKTTNGGTTWSILDTGASKAPNAIVALDANRVLLVGPEGLRLSTDGGNSFDAVRSKAVRGRSLDDVDLAGGSAVLAFGPRTLAISKDGGDSWRKVKSSKKKRLRDADFLTARKGYALTTVGGVMKTTNGGKDWKGLPGVGTDQGEGITFSNRNDGYLTTSEFGREQFGYALRTTDGGKTWQPQLIAPALVEAWDAGSTAFAIIQGGGGCFATTTGGQFGSPSSVTLDVSKRRLVGKKTHVKVTGKLDPPEGGEQVVVSSRKAGGSDWSSKTLTAASNGRFTARFKIRKKSFVVAQWSGDDERSGAGSKALVLKPRKKKHH
jgi:photosystem II stability/assembly factor-like uncharacterized protein